MDNADDSDNNEISSIDSPSSGENNSNQNNSRALLYEEVANTVWFASDSRLDFLEYNKTLYLNYMPDGMKTTKWIQLTGNGTKVVSAKVIWSESIREIGQTSNVSIYIDEYNKVHFECDFFELTGMDKIEGVEPARFYKDSLPALKSDYLSNLAGEYTLNNGWKLQIGAKLSIHKDVSHYWFANVLATEYDEDKKTYDLLLAHTSQRGAAGSTSPGITGKEPFVTKQGLFWNHCILTNQGGEWNVKWSSDWYDSPAEASKSSDFDNSYTFSGPTETKIHYAYNFYFGVPGKDSGGWCCVERGEWLGVYEYDSYIDKPSTWKDLKSKFEYKKFIPKDKVEDYWWYSSNSATSIEEHYAYKLSDSLELPLNNYNFYLVLKDKPKAEDVYVLEGTYKTANGKNELIVTKTSITYNGQEYRIKKGYIWDKFSDNEKPNKCCYLLSSDDGKDYTFEIDWQINSGKERDNFVNIYAPKEYDNSEIPAEWNTDTCSKFRGKRVGTLKKQ